jgi:hypothetical protein
MMHRDLPAPRSPCFCAPQKHGKCGIRQFNTVGHECRKAMNVELQDPVTYYVTTAYFE